MRPVLPSQRVCVMLLVAAVVVALLGGCSTKTQRLYRRAEAFFAQEQYELAAREYSRIVQEAPRDPLADDAWYKLAYLYREELDNPSAALIVYRDLVDNYEDSNYADEALFWMVYLQRRHMQDPAAAVATCRELDRRFPDKKNLRGQAYLEAAGAYLDADQLQQAQQLCQQIVDQFADRPRIAARALLISAEITGDVAVSNLRRFHHHFTKISGLQHACLLFSNSHSFHGEHRAPQGSPRKPVCYPRNHGFQQQVICKDRASQIRWDVIRRYYERAGFAACRLCCNLP